MALVREYLLYLRVEKGLRPLSCEAYGRDLGMFSEYLEGTHAVLETAQQREVAGFLEHLHRHQIEARSVARKLSCLRGFYKWLLLDKRIRHDPTVNIESPKAWKVLPKALAESETAEMLDAATVAATGAAGDAVALRDRAILELLYAGGVRVSELTGLRVEDLQLDAGRVMVRGKGDKERVVPLGRAAVEALAEYLERGTADARRKQPWRWPVSLAAGKDAYARLDMGAGEEQIRAAAPARICCGIAAPPTWWGMAPICAPCRRCWGTPTLRRRRCIRIWRSTG